MFLLITGVILVKNEEKSINECIKNLSFCDEILIIDDYSKDKTVESVAKLNNKKVKVITHPLDGDYSKARDFGLSQAKGEWVLFIDADERISDALAFEVSNAVHQLTDQSLSEYSGYYIRRKDFMWGKMLNYGETGGIKLLRLARKNAGEWRGKVHEQWAVGGKIGILNNYLVHYPHQTIEEFIKEINNYTDIRSQELYLKKIKVNWWSIIFYPVGKFLNSYIFKKGLLDGQRGLIVALIMSFHSFLVRGKLWGMQGKK